MWCIPRGIQQKPAQHAHHHHHHHAHLYNIDPVARDLVPPKPAHPHISRHSTRTAAPRAAPHPRHQSGGRSRRGWPLPRRQGDMALAVRASTRVTEDGTRSTGRRAKGPGVRSSQGLGTGRGPKGKGGKGDVGPRGQTGRGAGATGGGQSVGRETGGGAPPEPDVQPVWCIPRGIQQMPAQHAHHHHHHHAHLYNIDPVARDLVPPKPAHPHISRHPTRTAAPRAAPHPRHQSGGRSRRGWPLPRRQGDMARRLRGRRRGGRRSRHGGQSGPGTGTGTRKQSRTPWGARPSPW